MKTAVVLACIACLAGCVLAQTEEVPSSCLEKLGLSLSDIPGLIRDTSEQGVRQRGCLEACVMQKLGLMISNVINLDAINEKIDKVLSNSDNKENVRQSIHNCAAEAAGSDECVVAQAFARCGLGQLRLGIDQLLHQQA